MKRVLLMIGTRKGAFLAFSSQERRQWELRGPFYKGVEVNYVAWIPESGAVMVAGKSSWWGPDVRTSYDLGETWQEESGGVRFTPDRDKTVERIWILRPGSLAGRPILYAGVDPGALFCSADGGKSWSEVASLTDHPTRAKWTPGAGGLMVHSLCSSKEGDRIWAGISAAGVFRSEDGGKSWTPRNRGVRADFLPEKLPEVGQCVHHMEAHPQNPEILYQQNHCGVYRSDNGGDDWVDISEGLPSRFGFPLAVLPHEGDTLFVIPEEADTFRMTLDGEFRIFRSRNRGETWEPLTRGLPQTGAYVNVYRTAMTTDSLDPAGVYVGTQGGQLLASRTGGDNWEVLFPWLPPIYSLQTALVA